MKFSKSYKKLYQPVFTTIRKNTGYYKVGQTIQVTVQEKHTFSAEIASIRPIALKDITETMAMRDADCSRKELIELMCLFYKKEANNLILITLMKTYE